jgi:hypothetical protein
MGAQVENRHPPGWALKVINPVLRRVLPTRVGARVPLALLRVTGRRTGRRYEIPVSVWPVDEGLVVFTDAGWLHNFRGGAPAELVQHGRARPVYGDVIEDPSRVGPWLRAAVTKASARQVGLAVPDGHTISDAEAVAVRKALLLRDPPATGATPS